MATAPKKPVPAPTDLGKPTAEAEARSMGTYKEPVKKAKGGSVSSASARADGCAQRGKTRGKMV